MSTIYPSYLTLKKQRDEYKRNPPNLKSSALSTSQPVPFDAIFRATNTYKKRTINYPTSPKRAMRSCKITQPLIHSEPAPTAKQNQAPQNQLLNDTLGSNLLSPSNRTRHHISPIKFEIIEPSPARGNSATCPSSNSTHKPPIENASTANGTKRFSITKNLFLEDSSPTLSPRTRTDGKQNITSQEANNHDIKDNIKSPKSSKKDNEGRPSFQHELKPKSIPNKELPESQCESISTPARRYNDHGTHPISCVKSNQTHFSSFAPPSSESQHESVYSKISQQQKNNQQVQQPQKDVGSPSKHFASIIDELSPQVESYSQLRLEYLELKEQYNKLSASDEALQVENAHYQLQISVKEDAEIKLQSQAKEYGQELLITKNELELALEQTRALSTDNHKLKQELSKYKAELRNKKISEDWRVLEQDFEKAEGELRDSIEGAVECIDQKRLAAEQLGRREEEFQFLKTREIALQQEVEQLKVQSSQKQRDLEVFNSEVLMSSQEIDQKFEMLLQKFAEEKQTTELEARDHNRMEEENEQLKREVEHLRAENRKMLEYFKKPEFSDTSSNRSSSVKCRALTIPRPKLSMHSRNQSSSRGSDMAYDDTSASRRTISMGGETGTNEDLIKRLKEENEKLKLKKQKKQIECDTLRTAMTDSISTLTKRVADVTQELEHERAKNYPSERFSTVDTMTTLQHVGSVGYRKRRPKSDMLVTFAL